ncbi:MAG: VOC family protein [Thermomicrobiales bacterium]
MSIELDHILICAPVGAPAAGRLIEAGFSEGTPNRHPGQGTVNRRFFFDNAFIEFIWVEDEDEARSDLVAPTQIWERWNWRETGFSPFEICLRLDDGDEPPFETVDYRPPYIPEGSSIPIVTGVQPAEPGIFINSMGVRPADVSRDARQPLEHPNGAREISHVLVGSPESTGMSEPVLSLTRLGFVSLGQSREHLIEISFDEKRQGQRLDLQPDLPVILHW